MHELEVAQLRLKPWLMFGAPTEDELAKVFSLDATFRASPLLLYVTFAYTVSRHSLLCKPDRVFLTF